MDEEETNKKWDSEPKIIIIGSGISGIAAGEYLSRKGFKNFKILEASNRTGGRIWSVNVGEDGHKAELGANWIHGIERNPIYQIADQNHLLQLRNKDKSLRRRDLFYSEDGEMISEKMVKEVDFTYGMLIQQCEDYFQSNLPTPEENDSVGAFLHREFQEKLNKYSNGDRLLRESIFNQRTLLECCISGCDRLEEVSLGEFGCYEELPGIHYTIPPGFETVLEILKKNIPKENILLNTPVKTVHWDMQDKSCGEVCVECENGEKFYANHVISTVSLGVLKAACDRMFNPSLTEEKLHAIDNLGFGIVDKVILEFDQPIVDDDVFRIELLWDKLKDPLRDLRKTWYRKIYSFEVVHENILVENDSELGRIETKRFFIMGWLSGKEALFMESLTEEEIGEDCVNVLKKFLRKDDIPPPKRVLRTRWGNNPFTRGSYSFVAVGSCQSDLYALMEPLQAPGMDKPQVMFAGEATHPSFYSTTHGALLTGYREAQRIIKMYTQ
ncbi:spermine oxidase-like isoform X1 [Haliotis asinina]|uniref:spermine oxidase-like isoform X1 n=1 Tax=Haliotis asinina TaxID=109174 RepID=UPI00353266B3